MSRIVDEPMRSPMRTIRPLMIARRRCCEYRIEPTTRSGSAATSVARGSGVTWGTPEAAQSERRRSRRARRGLLPVRAVQPEAPRVRAPAPDWLVRVQQGSTRRPWPGRRRAHQLRCCQLHPHLSPYASFRLEEVGLITAWEAMAIAGHSAATSTERVSGFRYCLGIDSAQRVECFDRQCSMRTDRGRQRAQVRHPATQDHAFHRRAKRLAEEHHRSAEFRGESFVNGFGGISKPPWDLTSEQQDAVADDGHAHRVRLERHICAVVPGSVRP